jgi:mannose-6-phosphate isomerase-like protein (cupin superfamily)
MHSGYVIRHREDCAPVECPCGAATRVLTGEDSDVLSVHFVDISLEAEPHRHARLTEVYVVVEGEGAIELDGVREPVRPGSVVLIRPGTVHRAIGALKIINVVTPPFDPTDEEVLKGAP